LPLGHITNRPFFEIVVRTSNTPGTVRIGRGGPEGSTAKGWRYGERMSESSETETEGAMSPP
jgi:hypothetical protein